MSFNPDDYIENIRNSEKSIYDVIDPLDPEHYVPTPVLENLLNRALVGMSVKGLSPKKRSKELKIKVCEALGYPVPATFKRVQPRFTGQNFDTYGQQALNLQIWNELIDPDRRYVLIRIGPDDAVRLVRVVLGVDLIPYDTTGTVTTKYQASLDAAQQGVTRLEVCDSAELTPYVSNSATFPTSRNPSVNPVVGELLSIATIGLRLSPLVGQTFKDTGSVQDRNRGEGLHRMVCNALGYVEYGDTGQFPDVRHQLLEVKLQTAPTIDLGHVLPSSVAPVGVNPLNGFMPRHSDTRYAVFYGVINGPDVLLTDLHLVTGGTFFNRFRQFGGLTVNGKRQMILPKSLFGE